MAQINKDRSEQKSYNFIENNDYLILNGNDNEIQQKSLQNNGLNESYTIDFNYF